MTRKVIISGLFVLCIVLSNTPFTSAQNKQDAQSSNFTVPFHRVAKMIMVKATIKDQQGFLILDTGSPKIILNAAHFNPRIDGQLINDFKGNSSEVQTGFFSFSIGQVNIKNKRAILADLSHLEHKRNIKILGMVGSSMLKEYEILFDYAAKELTFFQLDKKGKRLGSTPFYTGPAHILPFKSKGHLACIEVSIGTTFLNVALDSGAGLNILDPGFQDELAGYCSDLRPAIVKGFSKQEARVNTFLLAGLQLVDFSFPPMRTFFNKLNQINNNLPGKKVDGLFGFEFFRHYMISINYKKKEVSIWDADRNDHMITRSD